MDYLEKVIDGHTIQVMFREEEGSVNFLSQCVECEQHNHFESSPDLAVEMMQMIDQESKFHSSGYEVDWHEGLAFFVDKSGSED